MLGLTKDGGGNSAEYYQEDNYYSQEGNPGDSEWLGRGSELAGLSGQVEAAEFNKIRAGIMPDGTASKSDRRTPGWDLTASAPKSVSIMALVADDKRLVTAHREASAYAAAYLERFAGTRVRDGNKVHHRHTGNLVIGRFTHDTSRAKDPNLHDHLYIMNATKDRGSDRWRAVDSRALYDAKEAAGRLYSARLKTNVERLGYEMTTPDRHGNSEIKGVPESLIDRFSKRKAAIDSLVAEGTRPATREARERAALLSRDAKTTHLNGSEKTQGWREESGVELARIEALKQTALHRSVGERLRSAIGSALPQRGKSEAQLLNPQSRTRTFHTESRALAIEAVQQALSHITENNAVFHESDIVAVALSTRQGQRVDPKEIIGVIDRSLKSGSLVKAEHFRPGEVTTSKILSAERKIIGAVKDPSVSWRLSHRVDVASSTDGLSKDQTKAFETAVKGSQRYAAIVGYAGTGKSYLVERIKNSVEKVDPDAKLIALAPMHKQVAEFRERLGVQTDTIAAFIQSNKHVLNHNGPPKEDHSKTIMIIDEAGMNSNEQASHLVQILDKMGVGRVVLMGDPRQKQSPAQGAPFAAMLKAGIARAEMRDIRRQKTPELRRAAVQAATGHTARALEIIGDRVHSTGEQSIEEAAFDHWRTLSPGQREDALIISTTLERRNRLNQLIRHAKISDPKLTQAERLGETPHAHTVLVSKRLSKVERNTGRGLVKGDQLLFHRALRGIDVKAGDQLTFLELDKAEKNARLQKADGSIVSYRLPGAEKQRTHYDAYTRQALELREREKVAWTKSDRHKGIKAGTTVQVVQIAANTVTLRDEQGREHSYDRKDPHLQHLNYAYSHTSFASQGMTKQTVIAVTGVNDRNSGDEAHSYVAMTRVGGEHAKNEHLAIFTDDKDRLMSRYQRELSKPDSGLLAINDQLVSKKYELSADRDGSIKPDLSGPQSRSEPTLERDHRSR